MQLYPVAKMAMNLHLKLFDDMSTSTDVSLTYYLSSVVQLVRKCRSTSVLLLEWICPLFA